jgi:hypothetical protein
MKYPDRVWAWLILLAGIAHLVATGILRQRGSWDTALVWIFAARLNLLRILKGYRARG